MSFTIFFLILEQLFTLGPNCEGTGSDGEVIKCGATQSGRGQWCKRCKNSPKAEQKFIEYTSREQQAGQRRRDRLLCGGGEGPQLQDRVREYRIFPFLVIFRTVPGCNWSVRACGYLDVGHSGSLFAFSPVVAVGRFALIRFPVFKLVA